MEDKLAGMLTSGPLIRYCPHSNAIIFINGICIDINSRELKSENSCGTSSKHKFICFGVNWHFSLLRDESHVLQIHPFDTKIYCKYILQQL